jgi:IclR family acetate operon transcriptional repressor
MDEKRQRGRPRLATGPDDMGSVQSLDRAIALLTIVAAADGLSLTEISRESGIAMSTAYRLLATLQKHGMVEFEDGTQLWFVGVETFRIGSSFLRRRKLAERARPIMQSLIGRCAETVNLAVLEDMSLVFVSQIETHEPLRAFFRPGTRSPLHSSGAGKAILSHLPEERVRAIVARRGLPRYTEHTITDAALLTDELAAIRQRGFALDDEERHVGMRCVAAAIFNEFGEPVAGVSVSGPTARVTLDAALAYGPLVRDAARDITHAIAGKEPGETSGIGRQAAG